MLWAWIEMVSFAKMCWISIRLGHQATILTFDDELGSRDGLSQQVGGDALDGSGITQPRALQDDGAAFLLLLHLDAVAREDLHVVLVPLDARLRGAEDSNSELDLKRIRPGHDIIGQRVR